MYLARFSIDRDSYVQAALFVDVLPDDAQRSGAWRCEMERFVSTLAALPFAWTTHRIVLRSNRLVRHWIITVPASAEKSLLRWCAGLVRVARVAPTLIRLVDGRESHDALLADGPNCFARIELPVYTAGCIPGVGAIWLGGKFLLAEHIDALLEQALLDERDLVFQATFTPQEMDSDTLSEVMKNRVRLREIPGIGGSRQASFTELVDKYAQSTHRVAEFIGCSGADPTQWLRNLLRRLAAPTAFQPDIDLSRDCMDGYELAIDLNAPDDGPSSVLAARNFADIARVLCWTSSQLSRALFFDPVTSANGFDDQLDQAEAACAPPGEIRPRPFVFISYCRRDAAALEHVVASLRDAGHSAWWDHQIPGGAEWLQMLEQRLEECVAVVALISVASSRSRFVRDELTYAHIIGKPVVPVKLDEAPVANGLRLALMHRNWITALDPDLAKSLRVALRSSIPTRSEG